MFEKHFQCTFDLLKEIPSFHDNGISIADDILAFNQMVPGSSNCRLIRGGRPAEDRYELKLSARDILDLNHLILRPEWSLGSQKIEDWFKPRFFESNFWIMWSTMFSFQRWHSLIEMRRYLRRFIHLFPGFTRIAGILRTRYNQYDSLIAPIVTWLRDQSVRLVTESQVADIEIKGTKDERYVTSLLMDDGAMLTVSNNDCVYLTLGSMTDGSVTGSNVRAPSLNDQEGGAWRLWRKLSARYGDFGNPDAFCGQTVKTAWHSFTVTMDSPEFFEFMEDYTNNRTGTGGLVTIADSSWYLSFVLFHQPHFQTQKNGTYVFWGYGLRGDLDGDFIKKPMWQATGDEIITELCEQLRLTVEQRSWFKCARVVPCRMPFITTQFMPRKAGDRPEIRPRGSGNFAVIGQYCEQPHDCVFTVEYSVRSAKSAVSSLTGLVEPPPPVARTDLQPMSVIRAARVLLGK